MDLFTYLMAKNGHNTSIHEDLFSYLLGKSQGGGGEIKTATGITINIPDAKKLVSFMMTKESTQETTTGKNLINILGFLDTQEKVYTRNGVTATINDNGTITLNGTATANSDFYFNLQTINGENKKLVINNSVGTFSGNTYFYGYSMNFENGRHVDISSATSDTKILVAAEYRRFEIYARSGNTYNNAIFELMVVDTSVTDLSYEKYTGGIPSPNPDYPQEVKTVTGSVDVYVSNGEITNTYTINLGNNELVGIGEYKDELKVDKSGHVWLNKKTKKIVLNGSENYNVYNASGNQLRRIAITYNIDKPAIFEYVGSNPFGTGLSNYFLVEDSTKNLNMFLQLTASLTWYLGITDSDSKWATANDLKNWLSTHNTDVYYPLATPELIDLQTTVDLSLFKGVNNVSNSVDGYMTIEYK